MVQDPKEQEIQRQFLDEAQEYLGALESAVLGLAGSRVDLDKLNEAMRASHSIKGGAAMMGYQILSDLAHRLEDSFKVLKTKRQTLDVSLDLENQLLSAVDCLQRVIQMARQEMPIDEAWLNQSAYPLFEQLRAELGEAEEETAASVLGGDDGSQALLDIVFSSEVEAVLQQLEDLIQQNTPASALRNELMTLAGELGGLGEMLQLPAFSQFCASVVDAVDVASTSGHPNSDHPNMASIAQAALDSWRRSQALVLAQQIDLLPREFVLPEAAAAEAIPSSVIDFPEVTSAQNLQPSIAEIAPAIDAPTANAPVADDPVVNDPAVNDPAAALASDLTAPSAPSAPSAPTVATPSPRHPGEKEDTDRTVRVSLKRIEQLNDLFGELTIERNALGLYCDRLRSLTQLLKQRVTTLEQSNQELRASYDEIAGGIRQRAPVPVGVTNGSFSIPSGPGLVTGSGSVAGSSSLLGSRAEQLEFDRLEMDRYDSLSLQSQTVMETIVQLQEVTTDVDLSLEEADQTLRNLNKTTKHLSNQLTHLRMRPLSDILDRFPRALRDLGQEYGKRVTLQLEGRETLVDRNVLEALQEPLMHLLRNAFDHGLESPEERQAQGKAEAGTIWIRARQQGNQTLIELQDDGRGIDLDKVRNKAVHMGLDGELLAGASQQELLSLIFEPGFSTSDRVTSLSGRGVGLDVVRDRLQPVRGEITVNTQPGQGTTFTLAVPFSLAVLRVLVVESQGMLLAIPADGVAEIVLMEHLDLETGEGAGEGATGDASVVWNGQSIQRIGLEPWLQFNCPRPPYSLEADPKIDSPALLVVQAEQGPVGLEIARSWGEQEVAIRQIEGQLGMPVGFSNCSIMGDGRVIPLVSIPELLHWMANYAEAGTAQDQQGMGDRPDLSQLTPLKPAVLVVDDSINVRRFLALTLEKAGYRVEQAKDGQQALELLTGDLSVQAIICDIEMPKLDGYGVLAQVKANPAIAHLPIAMLTSRSGDKHRKLAMNLGASAYFSKPYNEQELLQKLEAMMVAA